MKNEELRVENVEKRKPGFSFLNSQFSILNFVVAAFVTLSLLYNVALPIFEAPDEASHFIYASYLANERRLPDLNAPLPAHEVIQPPLYYALVALAVSPFDRTTLDTLTQLNTDWFDKDLNADFLSVRGQHLHTAAEQWPWSSAVWAVHIGRFVSTVLGAATIVFVYLTAGHVFGARSYDHAPLLCATLVAFNPKFIHVSSIVSNDIAITLACTVALWWMCRIANAELRLPNRVNNDAPSSFFNVQFLILGLYIGLAVLCKLQGLALLAPALVVVLLALRSGTTWAGVVKRGTWLLIGFAIVAGWYFIYNTVRYGNPLAWAQVQSANATLFRQPPLTLEQIIATVPLWFTTYWGSLGIRLEFDVWVNVLLFIALAVAVIGCVIAFAHRLPNINRSSLLLLVVAKVSVLALYIAWLRSYIATENGRLIFPGITAVVVLVVLGWMALLPTRVRRTASLAIGAGMLALSAAAPFTTILPAYAAPEALPREQLAARYTLPNPNGVATFGGDIRLMHAQLNQTHVRAGESVGVTLFWGGIRSMQQSYRVLLEALDANNEIIGRKLFIPFNGRFATQRWQPGLYFKDDYALPIDPSAWRGVTRVQISIFAQYPEPGLLPVDGTNSNTVLVGRVKVDAPVQLPDEMAAPPIATFGGMIELQSVHTSPTSIQFDWRAVKQPIADYTLFIHVLDANGTLIAQQDAQPFDGQYPTGLWDSGERVRDTRQITLLPEARILRIGWYDVITGQRLSAQKSDGSMWQDDVVLVDIR